MPQVKKVSLSKSTRRIPKEEEVNAVEKNLALLKDQIEKARGYIRNNDWTLIHNKNDMAIEFELQSTMTSQIIAWNETYMKLCGIMDIYERSEAEKKKGSVFRGGEIPSGVMALADFEMKRDMNKTARSKEEPEEEDVEPEVEEAEQ